MRKCLPMEKIEIQEIHYKETWDIRHKVMWPNQSIDYVKLSKDPTGLHLGLLVKGKIVSIISVFITGKEAQFRKFATLTEEQGNGYGSKLLEYLMNKLAQMQIMRVWCNARTDKTYFYERFGLTQTNEHFTKGGINYIIMEKLVIY